jgi:hypothetical protein
VHFWNTFRSKSDSARRIIEVTYYIIILLQTMEFLDQNVPKIPFRAFRPCVETLLAGQKGLAVARHFVGLWSFSVSRGSIFSSRAHLAGVQAAGLSAPEPCQVVRCGGQRHLHRRFFQSSPPELSQASLFLQHSENRFNQRFAPPVNRPSPPGHLICAASDAAPGPWPSGLIRCSTIR